MIFPAGVNDHGQPINLQLLGRAWDDDKLRRHGLRVRALAAKDGKGHVAPATAPALPVVTRRPGTVGGSVPATLVAHARRAGDLRRVHAGRGEGLHGVDDRRTCISTAGDAALTVSDPGHLTQRRRSRCRQPLRGRVLARRPGRRRSPTTR